MSFDTVLLLSRQYHAMAFIVERQSGPSRNSSFQFQVDQTEPFCLSSKLFLYRFIGIEMSYLSIHHNVHHTSRCCYYNSYPYELSA